MEYYKDKSNQVYAYEKNESQDQFIKKNLILITRDEMHELTKPTRDQIKFNNQIIIKSLIYEATQNISLLEDAISFGITKDGDSEKLKMLRKYRVLLSLVDTTKDEMELPRRIVN